MLVIRVVALRELRYAVSVVIFVVVGRSVGTGPVLLRESTMFAAIEPGSEELVVWLWKAIKNYAGAAPDTFQLCAAPLPGDNVSTKNVNSAFVGTGLE